VLRSVAAAFDDPDVQMATPVKKVVTPEELEDPSLVRVAIDKKGDAMYFTRSVIPFLRDEPDRKHWMHKYPFYRHIGIYAYRKNFLLGLAQLPAGELEQAEKLEQLRVLENGYKIRTVLTGFAGMSVDTEMDLTEINRYVRENNLTADGKL
jgi:3-deoxy-manno-octulosonate cytidylyltransferase (CMP-KDO synthetase)